MQTIEVREAKPQATDNTKLVAAALAVLVFCIRVFSSGVSAFLPDIVLQVVAPLYSPIVHALLLLALCTTRRRWSAIGLCGIACLVSVLALSYFRKGAPSELVTLVLFVIAAGDSRMDVLMRTYFCAILGALATVAIMDACHLSSASWDIPNGFWVYSYGVGHPNGMGAFLFSTLAAMALAIDRRRFLVPLLLCCAGAIFTAFLVLSCRTAGVLALLLTVAVIVEALCPRWIAKLELNGVLAIAVTVGLGVLALLILAGTVRYSGDNGLFGFLDKLTNMRVRHGNEAYRYVGGFTLFGQSVAFPSNEDYLIRGAERFYVDSTYVRYGLFYGLIPAACLFLTLCRAALSTEDRRMSTMMWVVMGLFALYGATESVATFISWDCALLVLSAGLLPRMGRASDQAAAQDNNPSGTTTPHLQVGLRGLAQGLSMLIYCAVLVLLAHQALSNGTGTHDISEEFPRSVSISCSPELIPSLYAENDGIEATASLASPEFIQAEFRSGEPVQGEVLGNPIVGELRKMGTRGDALRYLVSPARQNDDAQNGKWGVYLLAPGRGALGSQLGRWALYVIDYQTETTVGTWLKLRADGTALFGSTELDATTADDSALAPYERAGSWELVEEDGATNVMCRFGDEWLTVSIEGRRQ